MAADQLLGPAEIRRLAAQLDLRPTKSRGQNFVIDANTVRMIASKAQVRPDDVVLEVGPGLGSLTLALLPLAARVTAVEVDSVLADALPATVERHAPELVANLEVVTADAVTLQQLPGPAPTALVANLPYNVAVPVLLESLHRWPSISHGLVMVQKEVADRLCAQPGNRTYGVPSVKLAWYAQAQPAGVVSASVFWPAPRVASGLVRFERREHTGAESLRKSAFAAIDAAFAQRRKVLRSSLKEWAGGSDEVGRILDQCGISPTARGETLGADDFRCLASRHSTVASA